MERNLATGEKTILNQRIEMLALRADGTEFPVELSITRISTGGTPLYTAYMRDISERKRQERHRNAHLVLTQVLAEAATIGEAAKGVLQAVCENLGWDVGVFWLLRPNAEALSCLEFWHLHGLEVAQFEASSRRRLFRPGEGLPGRVWADRKPHWILDLLNDTNFPRSAIAAQEGLHGAIACPVMVGNETLGTIELFSRRVQEPDSYLLEMMANVAAQVGQFLERMRAKEERDCFFTVGTDMLVVAGFDGYFRRLNPAWERVLGWTAEELTTRPWLDFVHLDDWEATQADTEKLIAARKRIPLRIATEPKPESIVGSVGRPSRTRKND